MQMRARWRSCPFSWVAGLSCNCVPVGVRVRSRGWRRMRRGRRVRGIARAFVCGCVAVALCYRARIRARRSGVTVGAFPCADDGVRNGISSGIAFSRVPLRRRCAGGGISCKCVPVGVYARSCGWWAYAARSACPWDCPCFRGGLCHRCALLSSPRLCIAGRWSAVSLVPTVACVMVYLRVSPFSAFPCADGVSVAGLACKCVPVGVRVRSCGWWAHAARARRRSCPFSRPALVAGRGMLCIRVRPCGGAARPGCGHPRRHAVRMACPLVSALTLRGHFTGGGGSVGRAVSALAVCDGRSVGAGAVLCCLTSIIMCRSCARRSATG